MPNLGTVKDFTDAKYKMATNSTLISYWANLANDLGYSWCGGTGLQYVGQDFSTIYSPSASSYQIKANYKASDPYAAGYRASDRLVMTMSDMDVLIDPSKFHYGTPLISSMKPVSTDTFYVTNPGPSEVVGARTFSYQLSNSVTHSTSYNFTEGFSLKQKWSAGIPGLGASETELAFSFSATQGWSDATSTQTTKSDTLAVTVHVPPQSKVGINLFATQTQSEVSYTAQAIYNYNMKLHSFLRWSGNAKIGHPKNRPEFDFTFGTGTMNALDHLSDLYSHRGIAGYNETWDWDWVEKNYPGIDSLVSGMTGDPVVMNFSGKFQNVFGTSVNYVTGDPEPLTPAEAAAAAASVADPSSSPITLSSLVDSSKRAVLAGPRRLTSDFSTRGFALTGVSGGPGFFKPAAAAPSDVGSIATTMPRARL